MSYVFPGGVGLTAGKLWLGYYKWIYLLYIY